MASPTTITTPVHTVSAGRYTEEEFLQRERHEIFARTWLVAGPEAWLRRPDSWFVFDRLGESVLVTRSRDGQVRAFHNACRHRGSRVATGRGCSERLQCPYHGWVYELDGSLHRAPRPNGLEDPPDGLLAVSAAVWLGQVWVNLDPQAPPLEDYLGPLVAEFEPYEVEDMVPLQSFRRTLPVNWKVLLENGIETYHVGAVHSRSVAPADVRQIDLASFGDHSRQRQELLAELPGRAWLDRASSRGGPYTDVQLRALHKYMIFPNLLVNLLPCHVTFIQVFPLTAATSELRYTFARRKGARGVELARAVVSWLGSRQILREDLAAIRAFQAGASSGGVGRLHQEETAIGHFHAVIDRWLGGS